MRIIIPEQILGLIPDVGMVLCIFCQDSDDVFVLFLESVEFILHIVDMCLMTMDLVVGCLEVTFILVIEFQYLFMCPLDLS